MYKYRTEYTVTLLSPSASVGHTVIVTFAGEYPIDIEWVDHPGFDDAALGVMEYALFDGPISVGDKFDMGSIAPDLTARVDAITDID